MRLLSLLSLFALVFAIPAPGAPAADPPAKLRIIVFEAPSNRLEHIGPLLRPR